MGHNINYDSFGDAVAASAIDGEDQVVVRTDPSGTPSTKLTSKLNFLGAPGTELTIASGAVTITDNYHTIDTESDAASDDLDTINGGVTGMLLTVVAANAARSVVLKDGTGNINAGAAGTPGDITLDEVENAVTLVYTGSAWNVVSHGQNA